MTNNLSVANNLSEHLVAALKPSSAAAEAYRTLGINLLYALGSGSPTVVLTSTTGLGEGKSDICANLGVALARLGNRILAIDYNVREPQLHRHFGLPNTQGVMNILLGQCRLQEVWEEPVERLKVVTTGDLSPAPEILGNTYRNSELLAGAKEEFDCVLLDAPPVEVSSDATVLAAQADGVLLVLDEKYTDKASVRRSIRILEVVEANVVGTVVNNVKYLKE